MPHVYARGRGCAFLGFGNPGIGTELSRVFLNDTVRLLPRVLETMGEM